MGLKFKVPSNPILVISLVMIILKARNTSVFILAGVVGLATFGPEWRSHQAGVCADLGPKLGWTKSASGANARRNSNPEFPFSWFIHGGVSSEASSLLEGTPPTPRKGLPMWGRYYCWCQFRLQVNQPNDRGHKLRSGSQFFAPQQKGN